MPRRRSWLTLLSLACFCVLAWIQVETWRDTLEDRFVIRRESRSAAATTAITAMYFDTIDRWGFYRSHVGWVRERYHGDDVKWMDTFQSVHCWVFGFGYFHEKYVAWGLNGSKSNYDYQMATVPLWFLLLLSLILPIRWLWLTFRRRKAIDERLCESCRYDLRAHLPGQRCPECGTVIPVKSQEGDWPR